MGRPTADSIAEMVVDARALPDCIGVDLTPYFPADSSESVQVRSEHDEAAAEREARVAHPRTLTASFRAASLNG